MNYPQRGALFFSSSLFSFPLFLFFLFSWAMRKQHVDRTSATKMRMLWWISSKTRKYRIRKEELRDNPEVAQIEVK